jgi:hypothetical protein
MYLLFAYRELIRNLVVKDLKLKYRDSALGFLWSLVNPLLLIVVYSFVFGHILRGGPANFAYFIMVGILPWNFFAQSVMMSTGSIVDNGGLIRKVAIPTEVFPLATVVFNLTQFVLALLVFPPMALFFFRVEISWVSLWFFPLLILHLLFTIGLSFVISTATVFYRDAAVYALRRRKPARLIVAVPVAAAATCAEFRDEVEEIVCAERPEPFYAVGQWYEEFMQTSDDEVRDFLNRAAKPNVSKAARPKIQ